MSLVLFWLAKLENINDFTRKFQVILLTRSRCSSRNVKAPVQIVVCPLIMEIVYFNRYATKVGLIRTFSLASDSTEKVNLETIFF